MDFQVSKLADSIRRRLERHAVERDVEEELRFHLEMTAREFESQGVPGRDSLAQAKLKFGDYDRIKSECLEVASKNTLGLRVSRVLFIIAFILGVFIRVLTPEFRLTRIGDVLMMIGVFGGVWMAGKTFHRTQTVRIPESMKLGLRNDPIPHAFDKDGRTPFERVKADVD
jgi:hypothetical protein